MQSKYSNFFVTSSIEERYLDYKSGIVADLNKVSVDGGKVAKCEFLRTNIGEEPTESMEGCKLPMGYSVLLDTLDDAELAEFGKWLADKYLIRYYMYAYPHNLQTAYSLFKLEEKFKHSGVLSSLIEAILCERFDAHVGFKIDMAKRFGSEATFIVTYDDSPIAEVTFMVVAYDSNYSRAKTYIATLNSLSGSHSVYLGESTVDSLRAVFARKFNNFIHEYKTEMGY